MIIELFNSLSNALTANPAIALGAAFIWGVLSILLSPCHLASIPLIVGFLNGQAVLNQRRAFGLSTMFTLGILLMMALIGLVTSMLGRLMGDVGAWVEPVMGVVFMIVALFISDIVRMPSFVSGINNRGRGAWAALSLGFLLGIALGPCSFAFMAPILGIAFGAAGSRLVFALALLGAYIIGHCLVIILAGTFAGKVQVYLNWSSQSKGTKTLRYVCAALVLAAGLYLIFK
jgi:cytochrome c-type biogenesis protein